MDSIKKADFMNGLRLFRMDCARFMSPGKLAVGVLLVCAICILAIGDMITPGIVFAPLELRLSLCDKFQEVLVFDRYKSLLVLGVSVSIVPAFAQDYRNQYFRYLMVRSNLAAYVVSRTTVFSLYIVCCIAVGFLLSSLCLFPVAILQGKGGYGFGVYQNLVNGRYAWLYLVLMAVNFGLSAVPVCNIGLLVSVWKPSTYVALGSTFFAYYLLYAATNEMPYFLSYSYLSSSPGTTGFDAVLYRFAVYLVLTVLTGRGVYRALVWRNHEGTL